MKQSRVIILVLACVAAGYWFRACNSPDPTIDPPNFAAHDSMTNRLRDSLGRERVTTLAKEYTITELKNINAGELAAIRSEVSKLRRLVSLDRVEIHTTDTIKTVLKDPFLHIRTDTMRGDTIIIAKRFDYYDNWLRLQGVAVGDSLTCNYWLKNKFTIKHERGRKPLFKPAPLLVHITNENPHSLTTGVNTYQIKPEKRRGFEHPVFAFAVGVGVGVVGGVLLTR